MALAHREPWQAALGEAVRACDPAGRHNNSKSLRNLYNALNNYRGTGCPCPVKPAGSSTLPDGNPLPVGAMVRNPRFRGLPPASRGSAGRTASMSARTHRRSSPTVNAAQRESVEHDRRRRCILRRQSTAPPVCGRYRDLPHLRHGTFPPAERPCSRSSNSWNASTLAGSDPRSARRPGT